MTISPINVNPTFQGPIASKVGNHIKDTITDSSDVRNKDAAVGGVVAAGGASGAAVVAGRLKSMRALAGKAQNIATQAVELNKKNASLLARFWTNIPKLFGKNTKASKWVASAMETVAKNKYVKGDGGAIGGTLAVGITAAQLYSAGDMAVDAVNTYTKK